MPFSEFSLRPKTKFNLIKNTMICDWKLEDFALPCIPHFLKNACDVHVQCGVENIGCLDESMPNMTHGSLNRTP